MGRVYIAEPEGGRAMRRCLVGLGCLVAALSSTTAGAVDLNGKWRFTSSSTATIVELTQSGSTLSFTYGVFPFTGSVTSVGGAFTTYNVGSHVSNPQAGILGRVMPSGNLPDGRRGG